MTTLFSILLLKLDSHLVYARGAAVCLFHHAALPPAEARANPASSSHMRSISTSQPPLLQFRLHRKCNLPNVSKPNGLVTTCLLLQQSFPARTASFVIADVPLTLQQAGMAPSKRYSQSSGFHGSKAGACSSCQLIPP